MTRRERAGIERLIGTLVTRLRDIVDHGGGLERDEAATIRTQIAGLRTKLASGGRN